MTASSKVTAVTPRTLYAQWTTNQTVSFDANGGKCATKSVVCAIGETYGELPVPTRSGQAFTGWFTAKTGGSKVAATTIVTEAAKRTLYAHWRAQARGLSITGFSMEKSEGGAIARSGRAVPGGGVLSFEAVEGEVYELQWTPALGEEWIVLRRWTAETDGPATIEVPATPGEATGFFRLAVPAE